MGREIASGNILLANSYSTGGISNYFPSAVIEGFFALFTNNSRVSHALSMVFLNSMVFIGIYYAVKILLGRKPNIFIVLSFAAIFFAQTHEGNGLECNWSHIPLASLIAAVLYYGKEKKSALAKFAIVALLAAWGDDYNYLYFLIPFVIENVIHCVRTRKVDRQLIWVGAGLFVYGILVLLRKVLSPEYVLYVYGFSPGGGHGFTTFTPVEKIGERLAQLCCAHAERAVLEQSI